MGDRTDATGAGVLPALLCVLLLPVLAALIWLAVAFERRHGQCIDLGNGLLLGHAAIVDLARPFGKPIAVPKHPDGTPVIRDETWEIHVTATTLHGLAMRSDPADDYRFAWRADAGLVFAEDDPEALDDGVDARWAAEHVQTGGPVQGNLASRHMVTGGEAMAREARAIVEAFRGGPHVFNLGHGITPEADPGNVARLVEVVRGG